MRMRASIYVRISLDRHHEELGIERQIEECVAFCESRGWEVGEIFADNDLSATSGVVRPEFERLLISNPEVVVCWHADRFIRLTSELERVIALGFNIHAVHARSEEHTSELQSRENLVCRLLLEKK